MPRSGEKATRKHLRGSSLLLAGRVLALATNFLLQVLTVRYLAKTDYGAFAYAMAIVSLGTNINLLGLHRAANRFVPIYHERRDYGSMFGTLIIAMGTIAGLGVALSILVFGLQGILTDSVVSNPLSVGLLLILIVLCPIQALDHLFEGIVATLGSPRAIFFCKQVLGPFLKLAAVLFVISVQGSVKLLAVGHLLAGVAGVLIYVLLIFGVLREQGLLRGFDRRVLRFPTRTIFSYSVPLFTADVSLILKTTVAVVILESCRGSAEVAGFLAVLPVAALNVLVLHVFSILFTPVASRLFERKDGDALTDLYWQSTIWGALLTFPVFCVCFLLAEPVTVFLFGNPYSSSGMVLAILAIGEYLTAAIGLSLSTLNVYGRVRFVSMSIIVAVLVGVILNLYLIPLYGAFGAAIATSGATVVQVVLIAVGLLRYTEVSLYKWVYWKVHLMLLVAALVLLIVQVVLKPPIVVTAVLISAASLLLIRINRDALRIADTFPELSRIPLVRSLI